MTNPVVIQSTMKLSEKIKKKFNQWEAVAFTAMSHFPRDYKCLWMFEGLPNPVWAQL